MEIILPMSLESLGYNKNTIKLQWMLSLFLLVSLFSSFKEKGR